MEQNNGHTRNITSAKIPLWSHLCIPQSYFLQHETDNNQGVFIQFTFTEISS